MNQGIQTIIYPTKDIGRAKMLFSRLLGVEPIVDSPHYIGYKIGDQHIGVDPNGHHSEPVGYYHVSDIEESLRSLQEAGAQTEQKATDVGGGRLIVTVKDAEGNLIGLIQNPITESENTKA